MNAPSSAVNRPHHTGSTTSAPVTVRNEVSPDSLNVRLCAKLGMVVHLNTAMTLDETFVSPYWRDQRGFAHAVLDFTHDLLATTERLPRDVEFRRRYLNHTDQWRVLLIRGCDIFEADAETDSLAAAGAFEQLLIAEKARV